MFTVVLLVGGISLGACVTLLAERILRAEKAAQFSQTSYSGGVSDTSGVPIHELDNVDTVELRLDGIKAWRSR
jgi:hypothetical protein